MTWYEQKMSELEAQPIFESSGARAPEPALAAVESDLGRPLPADYKEFVACHGQGGFASYVSAPVPTFSRGGNALVSVFYGTDPTLLYYLPKEFETWRWRMPAHVVPIAQDPGANQFVISVGPDDYGAVYYWDGEHTEIEKSRVQEMADELEDAGVDTSTLFLDGIILAWEERHATELDRPVGYGNLYRIADSFRGFIELLAPYEPPAS